MLHKKVQTSSLNRSEQSIIPLYSRHALTGNVSRYDFPEQGMLPETAYNLVHDELLLDGNSRLNLATFVTTWMEPEARALLAETFDKNMIDKDEYPRTVDTFPPHLEDVSVLRIVVKDGFSHEMANMLLDDLRRHLKFFASQPGCAYARWRWVQSWSLQA